MVNYKRISSPPNVIHVAYIQFNFEQYWKVERMPKVLALLHSSLQEQPSLLLLEKRLALTLTGYYGAFQKRKRFLTGSVFFTTVNVCMHNILVHTTQSYIPIINIYLSRLLSTHGSSHLSNIYMTIWYISYSSNNEFYRHCKA